MIRLFILALSMGVIFSGCTSAVISQSLAAGTIGCQPERIAITNETVNSGVHNFTASCDGKDYFCTYMYPNPISCKERAK